MPIHVIMSLYIEYTGIMEHLLSPEYLQNTHQYVVHYSRYDIHVAYASSLGQEKGYDKMGFVVDKTLYSIKILPSFRIERGASNPQTAR